MLQNSLYNLSIRAYVLIIKVLAPFNTKARLWVEGRKKLNYQLSTIGELRSDKLAWFHCASLGEFEQGRPVMEAFRVKFPDYKILLTFFSPSGYEVRKNYTGADFIIYLPADTPQNAKEFIEAIKPTVAFFVKYEFWRNYLLELEKKQIPAICFSAIFRPNQLFFKSYGGFYRAILFKFKHIFVQNEESINLLQSVGYQAFTRVGDTRFDRVKQIADSVNAHQLAVSSVFEQFKNQQQILIVGSAWAADMEVLIPMINSGLNLKYIIAPHEINPNEIMAWQGQIRAKSIRFSELNAGTDLRDSEVLFIDNIGMLSSLYQYAEFAFIGGSFGKGLHNILEAATFGMPLFFGDKAYQKFQEARDLVALGGAFPIKDSEAISLIINDLIKNSAKQKALAAICRNYVLQNIGATEKIIEFCSKILKK